MGDIWSYQNLFSAWFKLFLGSWSVYFNKFRPQTLWSTVHSYRMEGRNPLSSATYSTILVRPEKKNQIVHIFKAIIPTSKRVWKRSLLRWCPWSDCWCPNSNSLFIHASVLALKSVVKRFWHQHCAAEVSMLKFLKKIPVSAVLWLYIRGSGGQHR